MALDARTVYAEESKFVFSGHLSHEQEELTKSLTEKCKESGLSVSRILAALEYTKAAVLDSPCKII